MLPHLPLYLTLPTVLEGHTIGTGGENKARGGGEMPKAALQQVANPAPQGPATEQDGGV